MLDAITSTMPEHTLQRARQNKTSGCRRLTQTLGTREFHLFATSAMALPCMFHRRYYRNTRTSESRWTLPTADADAVDDDTPYVSTTPAPKSAWQPFWDPVQGLYRYRQDINEYRWPDGTEDENKAPEYALPAITETHIAALIDMGFAQDQAVAALFRFGGDCTRATESLLGEGPDAGTGENDHDQPPTYNDAASDAEDSGELTPGVRQLVAMGYDVAVAKDACARTETLSAAVELLTTMNDGQPNRDPKIVQLEQMGFTEDQAREALAHTNQKVSEAIDFCLQNFSSPLSPEDVPPTPPSHQSESKQHSADGGWGLLARARRMASSAREGDAKPIRTLDEAEFDDMIYEAEFDDMAETPGSDSEVRGADETWTEPKRATALGAAGQEVLDLQKFYHAVIPTPEKQLAQQIEALLVPLAVQCEHLLTGPELNPTVGPALSPVAKALQSFEGDDEEWHLKTKPRRERSRALMKYDTELRGELAHRQKQWVLCGEMLKSLKATQEEHSLWLRSWGLMRHLPFFESRFKLCIDRANALKTLYYQAGHRLTQKLHSINEVLMSLKAISKANKTKSRTDKELYSITFADAVTAASKVTSQNYFTSVEAMLRSHPEIGHCLKSIHAYNAQLRELDAHALRLRQDLAPVRRIIRVYAIA